MHVIVPLAGPDQVMSNGTLKSERLVHGVPILEKILKSRSWHKDVEQYHFVFLDCFQTRKFVDEKLSKWFPSFTVQYLDSYTQGAALSAAACAGRIVNTEAPIVVDLADIEYKVSLNLDELIGSDYGAIALTFKSNNPIYSYLKFDGDVFMEAKEKQVISNRASAGTYFFKNIVIFLNSLAWHLSEGQSYKYNSLYYVCPLLNGVKAQGLRVKSAAVSNLIDIKIAKGSAE